MDKAWIQHETRKIRQQAFSEKRLCRDSCHTNPNDVNKSDALG